MRIGFPRSATRYAASFLLLLGSSTATLAVVTPPVIAKVFGAASIPVGGSTSLSFTIQNNDPATVLSGISFFDGMPPGLVVATPNALAGSCGGGTITATSGTGAVVLNGATLAPSTTCTFSINVTGMFAGTWVNTTSPVGSIEAGLGGTATASIDVLAAPFLDASFNAPAIPVGGTTTLDVTITNPPVNGAALAGIGFTDILPAGLTVASASSTACGGTLTLASPNSIALAGGNVAINDFCQFSITVTGTASGTVTNTTSAVTSTNGGTGNTSTSSLIVGPLPPALTMAFGAASVPVGGSTSLQFTIHDNDAASALTGVAFNDALPAGLAVATPNGLSGSCGGGTITATAGSRGVSLAGATLAASATCTFFVDVTGTTAGNQANTTIPFSSNSGIGASATASVDVIAPPVIFTLFIPSPIAPGASGSLSVTLANLAPNDAALTGVAFSDALPAGLTVAAASTPACGGTLTTTPPIGIALAGATIATGSSCQFDVPITGATAGIYTNTTGAVSSTNGGTGNSSSASLTVGITPTITASFGAASIGLDGTTPLTFTIANPNPGFALASAAFTDGLPAGLVVAPTPGIADSCGGTVTATAGSASVVLASGTVPASGSCSITVTVQGTTPGLKTNSVNATWNAGTTAPATATLTVNAAAVQPTAIPALDERALALLALSLLASGLHGSRKRKP